MRTPEALSKKTDLAPYHNTRPGLFDQLGIPRGWVINGKLPKEVLGLIKADAVPMMIKEDAFLLSPNVWSAKKRLEEMHKRYGEDLIVLLLPDEETFNGYSAGPVLISDLRKKPNVLLEEMIRAMKADDMGLESVKRSAYLAVTGHTDTK